MRNSRVKGLVNKPNSAPPGGQFMHKINHRFLCFKDYLSGMELTRTVTKSMIKNSRKKSLNFWSMKKSQLWIKQKTRQKFTNFFHNFLLDNLLCIWSGKYNFICKS